MSRERILSRIHRALEHRSKTELPAPLSLPNHSPEEALALFTERLTGNSGEVVVLDNISNAKDWLEYFAKGFEGVSIGEKVPTYLHPNLTRQPPEEAPLGISWALGAIADTGTVLVSSRDGRRTQLLPPSHVVFVPQSKIYPNLLEAFKVLKEDLPAAIGLHSGPSKSADIGQIMVKGVHGPGRLIAAVIRVMAD